MYLNEFKDRDRLSGFLAERGIETKIHYPVRIHLQPTALSLSSRAGVFAVCRAQVQSILTLPVQNLTNEEIVHVYQAIKDFYA